MRRWLLLAAAVVLLVCYCGLLYACLGSKEDTPIQTNPETTAEETTCPVITADTVPETEPAVTEATLPAKPAVDPDYLLTARHAFVYDCAAEELRFTLGEMNDSIAPASLTKLFTAYVALELLDPEDMITCGAEAAWIDPASSVAWVSPGDQVTVEMLIQGMMMQSGNDAAYVTAVAAGRALAQDSEYPARRALELFMEQVNVRAQELGLSGTHFSTPDGLDAWDHYSTPGDLLRIGLLAMEQPLLRHYTSLSRSSVMYDTGETYTYHSTNYLLNPDSKYYCADACGMKTGTTKKAGSCLLSLFYNGERYLLIGVFGCPQYEDRFADALQLYAIYG